MPKPLNRLSGLFVSMCLLATSSAHAQFNIYGGVTRYDVVYHARGLGNPRVFDPIAASPIPRRPLQALQRPVTLNVRDVPLKDFVKLLSQTTGMAFVLDDDALRDASVDIDIEVSLHANNIPLHEALEPVRRALDIAFVPQTNSLLVTSREEAKSITMEVVYPVLDLVAMVDRTDRDQVVAYMDFDTLYMVITETLSPDTWEEAGGLGRISLFPKAGAMAVSTTYDVHIQVERMLTALRQAQAAQGISGKAIPVDANDAPLPKESFASRSLGNATTTQPKRLRPTLRTGGWQMPR